MNQIRLFARSMGARALAVSGLLGLVGLAGGSAEAAPAPVTIGFIYVGPKTDYGYNQAHAEGAAVIAKLPGVKIREEEMVPETSAVQKTMESMINLDGATLLFPTSFGYFDPHILKEANKYKAVNFLHCGGMYQKQTDINLEKMDYLVDGVVGKTH
jgi:basic membrane protein A and related proteins